MRRAAARRVAAAPAPALFVAGAVSQYLGAALAVTLFDDVPAVGVGWWRVVGSALVLGAWLRPWRSRSGRGLRWGRAELRAAALFGVVLAAMNLTFYAAIDRLPLGTAVAIEFAGPVAVAALGTRSRRDGLALGLAVAGVALLADVSWEGSGLGVALALGSAVLWAGYIVLGRRVALGARGGLTGLAVGSAIGALVWSPLGLARGWAAFDAGPVVVLACLAVGVLSNAIPYGLDQVVLPRLSAASFALLLALLPATATLVGLIALGQVPGAVEIAGIALVVAAVACTVGAHAPTPTPTPT